MQHDVSISFDFCPKSDFNDDLYFTATNGANVVSCSIDGVELGTESFTRVFSKTGSTAKLFKTALKNDWQKITLVVRNINNASGFTITTSSVHTKTGNYGFYFDNFEVRSLYDASQKGSKRKTVAYACRFSHDCGLRCAFKYY